MSEQEKAFQTLRSLLDDNSVQIFWDSGMYEMLWGDCRFRGETLCQVFRVAQHEMNTKYLRKK